MANPTNGADNDPRRKASTAKPLASQPAARPRTPTPQLKLTAKPGDVRMTHSRGLTDPLSLRKPELHVRHKRLGFPHRKLKLGQIGERTKPIRPPETHLDIEDGDEIEGRVLTPGKSQVQGKSWSPTAGIMHPVIHANAVVAQFLGSLPYSSFELTGPTPPSQLPYEAVSFWLHTNARYIEQAEHRWSIDRRAIAGAIAWEALKNPQTQSASRHTPIIQGKNAVGAGKIHTVGEPGQLSWPEAVERSGRMPRLSEYARDRYLATPEGSIQYIGAIMDMISEVAEHNNFSIRQRPEILGFVYQSRTLRDWIRDMANKPRGRDFVVQPGTMGDWIQGNSHYLEEAVGKSGL